MQTSRMPLLTQITENMNFKEKAAEFCESYPSGAKNLLRGVSDPFLHKIMGEFVIDNMEEVAIQFHVYLKRKTDAGTILDLTYSELFKQFILNTYGKD